MQPLRQERSRSLNKTPLLFLNGERRQKMDEVREQYEEDLKEKNSIKKSAYRYAAKPVFNGYTEKQAAKKSGEVSTYSPERSLKMTWNEFVSQPENIVREHLDYFHAKGAFSSDLAEIWGVTRCTVNAHKRKVGAISDKKFGHGGIKRRNEMWMAYLNSLENVSADDQISEQKEDDGAVRFLPATIDAGYISVTGTWHEIFERLASLMSDDVMKFDISFRKETDKIDEGFRVQPDQVQL